MTIEAALQQFLVAQPAVAALIGAQLFPGELMPTTGTTYPIVMMVGTDGEWEGAIGGATDTGSPVFRFTAWGRFYEDAVAVDRAIRRALNGYSGEMLDVHVECVWSQNDTADTQDKVTRLFSRSTSYRIWYRESD